MNKITFQNFPSTDTPLNASNMNLLQTNTENAINSIDTLGFNGTAISSGDDLDSYTTAKVYYSNSTDITNSLSHCPITGAGFKLIVEYTTSSSRIVQTIKVNNASTSATYVRTYTGSWGDWVKVQNAVILYENTTGTTSDVTLSKSVSGFDEIEILYSMVAQKKSVKIPVRSSMTASLDGMYVGSQNMVIGTQNITLSGTSITRGTSAGKNINLSSNAITDNSTLTFTIFKVIGY